MTSQPAAGVQGRREGRTIMGLEYVAGDADRLVATMRAISPSRRADAAAIVTAGWTRRRLIDVALELARREAGIRRDPRSSSYDDRQQRAAEARRAKRQADRDAEDARWPDETELRTWARLYRRHGDRSNRALEAERVLRRRLRTQRQQLAQVTVTRIGAPDADR